MAEKGIKDKLLSMVKEIDEASEILHTDLDLDLKGKIKALMEDIDKIDSEQIKDLDFDFKGKLKFLYDEVDKAQVERNIIDKDRISKELAQLVKEITEASDELIPRK